MSSEKYLAAAAAGLVVLAGAVFVFHHTTPSRVEENETASSASRGAPVSAAASPAAMVVDAVSASPRDLQQAKVLDEVLLSRNDNDPRLDTELRNLSSNSKHLMEERYKTLAPEKRNERGTIAFLVGREISSAEDVAFMGGILSEAPCLSMGDCAREEKQPEDPHMHVETGMNVSLAYPQMVALHSLESQIEKVEKGAKPGFFGDIRKVLDLASKSPVPIVADKARGLAARAKNIQP